MASPLISMEYSGLHTVISGGQTGADQAGLHVAKEFNLKTGGSISRGYRTTFGSQPDLAQFDLVEHSSTAYPPRTKDNAFNGDATVRLASNFLTAGEVLTLRYVRAAGKPHFDALLNGMDHQQHAEGLVEFLINHNVGCLNVAGNADRDQVYGFHFKEASKILRIAFTILRDQNLILHI